MEKARLAGFFLYIDENKFASIVICAVSLYNMLSSFVALKINFYWHTIAQKNISLSLPLPNHEKWLYHELITYQVL